METDSQPISPGDFLASAMASKGLSQSELAYALDTAPATVNQILRGRRRISANMAKALSAALEMPASDFVKIQAVWDLEDAAPPEPNIEARSKIIAQYPLKEMLKRGWVSPPEHGRGTIEQQVCKLFGVSSLKDVPHLTHSAKKTDYERIPAEQLAWLFRVKQIAQEQVVSNYSPQKLKEAVEEMSSLRAEATGLRHVPRLLAEAGVRFVVVEGLPGGMIDGVCFWLNNDTPVIGMSLRFDRIDNAWFVLRHEIAHVLHGHGKDQAIIDSDIMGAQDVNEEERIANKDAADFCVPEKKMDSFFLRKKPFFADREVCAFAKRMGVHPGLVVGQLHRRMGEYNFLRRHLIAVRETLSGSMMVDGWGDVVPTSK